MLGGKVQLLLHAPLAGERWNHFIADRQTEPPVVSIRTFLRIRVFGGSAESILPRAFGFPRRSGRRQWNVADLRRHSLPVRHHRRADSWAVCCTYGFGL